MAHAIAVFIRQPDVELGGVGHLNGWVLSEFTSSQWLDQETIDGLVTALGNNVHIAHLPEEDAQEKA